jgi:hypothetical protein
VIEEKELKELDKITENVRMIREKNLLMINHPMDRLEGVNQSSIQKINFNLKPSEYNLGIVINSFILKISRLSIKKHTATIVELV